MIRRQELAHNVTKLVKDATVGEFLKYGYLSFFMPYQYKHWGLKDADGIGGKGVDDPLTIYASVDVYGGDDRITFKTTMKELLDDVHGGFESWVTYVLLGCHLFKRVTFLGVPVGFEIDRDDRVVWLTHFSPLV
jgi:hypothetical protein